MSDDERAERRPLGAWLAAGLAAALSAIGFFAWLAEEVLDGDTLRFDDRVRMLVHHFASPGLTTVMRIFTDIGQPPVLVALTLGLAAGMWWSLRWKRGTLMLVTTLAGASVLDLALKLAFHRARPVPFFGTPAPHSYSFPSGHALFSFCLFGITAVLVTSLNPSTAVRVAVWILAAVFAGMIGLSRIYLGVHYPSDVIGGYTAAFIWLMTVAIVNRMLERRGPHGD